MRAAQNANQQNISEYRLLSGKGHSREGKSVMLTYISLLARDLYKSVVGLVEGRRTIGGCTCVRCRKLDNECVE